MKKRKQDKYQYRGRIGTEKARVGRDEKDNISFADRPGVKPLSPEELFAKIHKPKDTGNFIDKGRNGVNMEYSPAPENLRETNPSVIIEKWKFYRSISHEDGKPVMHYLVSHEERIDPPGREFCVQVDWLDLEKLCGSNQNCTPEEKALRVELYEGFINSCLYHCGFDWQNDRSKRGSLMRALDILAADMGKAAKELQAGGNVTPMFTTPIDQAIEKYDLKKPTDLKGTGNFA